MAVPDLLGIETPLAQQPADRRRPQGGDPAELLVGGQVLADARRGKHAAIANQHHAAEPEAPPQLVDLGGHGGGVAGAHLGGNRAARGVAQQADEDLAAATLAVAGVAAAGQFGLDGGLAAGQPVEGVVELLLGDGTQAEGLVEGGELGVGGELAGGGEARGG